MQRELGLHFVCNNSVKYERRDLVDISLHSRLTMAFTEKMLPCGLVRCPHHIKRKYTNKCFLSQNGIIAKSAKESTIVFDARFLGQREPAAEDTLKIDVRLDGKYVKVIVVKTSVSPDSWNVVQTIGEESIVKICGTVVESSNSDVTMVSATSIKVVSLAAAETTRLMANAELEERLDNRILDVRRAASGAIFKLHSGMCQLIVEYLCSQGFHWIHTPRLITATIEGDNEYFKLPYFGKDVYLAQSSQHHKQMALSMDMQRVFEIGPVFRAEKKSNSSSRHMTEFTVLDIAMAFDDDYRQVVDLIEDMLVFVLRGLQERPQYSKLVKAVHQLYPDARPMRIGLDQHGRIPRATFLEAKGILREDLGTPSDNSKDFT